MNAGAMERSFINSDMNSRTNENKGIFIPFKFTVAEGDPELQRGISFTISAIF